MWDENFSISLLEEQELLADGITLCHNLWLHQDWTKFFTCFNGSLHMVRILRLGADLLHTLSVSPGVGVEIP